MVKLNKIYTRTGDKGSTQLGNGKRVEKNSLRVDAYGSIDEANAVIGLSILRTNTKIKKILQIIQNDLFDLGADLCIPDKKNIQKHLQNSLMLVTALNKHIGYDNAAKIAKKAFKENLTLKKAASKLNLINEKEFDKLINPKKMV